MGTLGEWYSFGISFFGVKEESFLVLETISPEHRDIPTRFVSVLLIGITLQTLHGRFYRFMIQCDRQGEKCFTLFHGTFMFLFVTKNNSLGVSWMSTHGKQIISALLVSDWPLDLFY